MRCVSKIALLLPKTALLLLILTGTSKAGAPDKKAPQKVQESDGPDPWAMIEKIQDMVHSDVADDAEKQLPRGDDDPVVPEPAPVPAPGPDLDPFIPEPDPTPAPGPNPLATMAKIQDQIRPDVADDAEQLPPGGDNPVVPDLPAPVPDPVGGEGRVDLPALGGAAAGEMRETQEPPVVDDLCTDAVQVIDSAMGGCDDLTICDSVHCQKAQGESATCGCASNSAPTEGSNLCLQVVTTTISSVMRGLPQVCDDLTGCNEVYCQKDEGDSTTCSCLDGSPNGVEDEQADDDAGITSNVRGGGLSVETGGGSDTLKVKKVLKLRGGAGPEAGATQTTTSGEDMKARVDPTVGADSAVSCDDVNMRQRRGRMVPCFAEHRETTEVQLNSESQCVDTCKANDRCIVAAYMRRRSMGICDLHAEPPGPDCVMWEGNPGSRFHEDDFRCTLGCPPGLNEVWEKRCSYSCMSGEARVVQPASDDIFSEDGARFKYVKDLTTEDVIRGLDENREWSFCKIEAVEGYGTGTVFGNYTRDHFILDEAGESVLPNGPVGEEDIVEKYAVLTSCPVGLDESGVGFTPFDSDFFGGGSVLWSDYVVVHRSILRIVKEVGPFVFSPATYTSMGKVAQYTERFYKTMLACAKDPDDCDAFEGAAEVLVENALTKEAMKKVKSRFGNLGKPKNTGSISAAVTMGKSVREAEN